MADIETLKELGTIVRHALCVVVPSTSPLIIHFVYTI